MFLGKTVRFTKREIAVVVMVLVRALMETSSKKHAFALGSFLHQVLVERNNRIPSEDFMSVHNIVRITSLNDIVDQAYRGSKLRTNNRLGTPAWRPTQTGDRPFIGDDVSLASTTKDGSPAVRDVMVSLVDEFLSMVTPEYRKTKTYFKYYYDSNNVTDHDRFELAEDRFKTAESKLFWCIGRMLKAYRFDITGSYCKKLDKYTEALVKLRQSNLGATKVLELGSYLVDIGVIPDTSLIDAGLIPKVDVVHKKTTWAEKRAELLKSIKRKKARLENARKRAMQAIPDPVVDVMTAIKSTSPSYEKVSQALDVMA